MTTEARYGAPDAHSLGREVLLDDKYRFDANVSHVLGRRQLLQGGIDVMSDEYRGYNRLLGDNAGQSVRMVDAWFQDRIQAHPRLSLTVGGRITHHSAFGTHAVPRFGMLYRASDKLRLRASYGHGFRAPDLGQLYYRFLTSSGWSTTCSTPPIRTSTVPIPPSIEPTPVAASASGCAGTSAWSRRLVVRKSRRSS